MGFVEAVVLGLVQGVTEFLPVSSSAHLRVVPELVGWGDPGASFTAIAQLGTAAAVVVVFRRDLLLIVRAAFGGLVLRSRRAEPEFALARQVVVGSVPIVVLGVAGAPLVGGPLRNLVVVAAALCVGSAWLWTSTRCAGTHPMTEATDSDAFLVGIAQAAALVPGVSRSGATIGAAYRLGLSPSAAARYSFLLSVPSVVLAGLFSLRDVNSSVELVPTAVAAVAAFVSGWASIRLLLRLVGTGRFTGLVAYRLVLAVVVVFVAAR
jgi:undecaprenyl-diphosphatase